MVHAKARSHEILVLIDDAFNYLLERGGAEIYQQAHGSRRVASEEEKPWGALGRPERNGNRFEIVRAIWAEVAATNTIRADLAVLAVARRRRVLPPVRAPITADRRHATQERRTSAIFRFSGVVCRFPTAVCRFPITLCRFSATLCRRKIAEERSPGADFRSPTTLCRQATTISEREIAAGKRSAARDDLSVARGGRQAANSGAQHKRVVRDLEPTGVNPSLQKLRQ